MSSFIITINYSFPLTHMLYGVWKMSLMNLFAGRHGGADVGDGLVHTVGRRE